ncbi:MAG: HEAT repeat domain-containing protein [Planctomycetes bacterium]|nr:HEAT repeat domain-containing protein [Planctomycetota bacterium]
MAAKQGEVALADERREEGAAPPPRTDLGHGPLAEAGGLLRLVQCAAEEGGAAAGGVLAGTPRVPWRRALALMVAAAWFAPAASSAVASDPPGLRPWLVPVGIVGVAAAGVFARVAWRTAGAGLDLFAIGLLGLAVVSAGSGAEPAWLALHATALSWLAVGTFAAAARQRAAVVVGLAAAGMLAGLGATAAHAPCAAALGRPAVQVLAVGLLAITATLGRPALLPGALRWREVTLLALAIAALAWALAGPGWHAPAGGSGIGLAAATGAVFGCVAGRAAGWAAGLALAVAAAVLGLPPRGDGADAARRLVLAVAGETRAVYQRATQAVQLTVAGEVVDRVGPDHAGAELAATVATLLAVPGDRTLVLGAGTGRLADALLATGRHEVEVVDARGDDPTVVAALRGDGPVPAATPVAADPRVRREVRSWRQALDRLDAGARQCIVVGELPHAAASIQSTLELQLALRRVAGHGFVLQQLALDLVPAGTLRALLGAAAAAHPWNAVLAVGDDALLLSATAPPSWPGEAAPRAWTADARWLAHRAHLGSVADVRRAVLGTVSPSAAAQARSDLDPPPPGGERGRRSALSVLHELLQPTPAPAATEADSLLLRWLGHSADLRLAVAELRRLGAEPADVARAQALAVRWLPAGAPAAALQAALGLPAAGDAPLVDPALACRRAHAIDPTFWLDLPPPLAGLPKPLAARGDLEDLARLPAPNRLAAACVGGSPTAVALRVRFATPCARALVEQLAAGPLSAAATEALRELADPFVLAEAARGLAARDGLLELLSLWRRDLPMPAALAELLRHGDDAVRARIVPALGGRRDAESLHALAGCLEAPAVELRRAAAMALQATFGDRIAYDPEWPGSARIEAADRVRALHNRTP